MSPLELAEHYLNLAKAQREAIKDELKGLLHDVTALLRGLSILGEKNVLADQRFKESVDFLKVQLGQQLAQPDATPATPEPPTAAPPPQGEQAVKLNEAAKTLTAPFTAAAVSRAANLTGTSYAIKKLVESGKWRKTGNGKGATYTVAS
jgi:hypothetical protein